MSPGSIAGLIVLADNALATAQTVSQGVIDLANGVRLAASEAQVWTGEHEQRFQANVTRLTGSNLPPVPTAVPQAAPAAADDSSAVNGGAPASDSGSGAAPLTNGESPAPANGSGSSAAPSYGTVAD